MRLQILTVLLALILISLEGCQIIDTLATTDETDVGINFIDGSYQQTTQTITTNAITNWLLVKSKTNSIFGAYLNLDISVRATDTNLMTSTNWNMVSIAEAFTNQSSNFASNLARTTQIDIPASYTPSFFVVMRTNNFVTNWLPNWTIAVVVSEVKTTNDWSVKLPWYIDIETYLLVREINTYTVTHTVSTKLSFDEGVYAKTITKKGESEASIFEYDYLSEEEIGTFIYTNGLLTSTIEQINGYSESGAQISTNYDSITYSTFCVAYESTNLYVDVTRSPTISSIIGLYSPLNGNYTNYSLYSRDGTTGSGATSTRVLTSSVRESLLTLNSDSSASFITKTTEGKVENTSTTYSNEQINITKSIWDGIRGEVSIELLELTNYATNKNLISQSESSSITYSEIIRYKTFVADGIRYFVSDSAIPYIRLDE